ncbi:CENPV (predicted) [Pycnogonum litorale]
MNEKQEVVHYGGCHCGAVRYTVRAPQQINVFICNCSICVKTQARHFIVPASAFRLLQGEDQLNTYTFGTHRAKHKFCKICGVKSFYIPRSNPDGYGIMPHCLDLGTITGIVEKSFDGKNWEEEMNRKPEMELLSKN